jgi:hypothetical protein
VALPNQTQSPNEVRIFERRAPAKRMPRNHPKPYQSLLWTLLETIRKLRRKHQTWAAIALHLKESHGVETTAATVFKFFKRAAIGRVPVGFTDATISTGRVGKSTVAEGLITWMRYAGIDFAAVDADSQHLSPAGIRKIRRYSTRQRLSMTSRGCSMNYQPSR